MGLRKITIARRLRYTFFLMALIPVLIVGGFASFVSTNAIIERTRSYSQQILDALQKNIKHELQRYESLADEIILHPVVQKGINDFEWSSDKEQKKFREGINAFLQRKFSAYPHIRDIKIIDVKGNQIYQKGYLLNDKRHVDNMVKVVKQNGQLVDCFGTKIYNNEYIVLSKLIYSVYNKQKIGYLLFVLEPSALSNLYGESDLGEGASIFVTDRQEKVLGETTQNLETILDGTRQLLMHAPVEDYGITLHGTIPYAYLERQSHAIQSNVILMVIVCFAVSILVSHLISRTIVVPLNQLVKCFDQAIGQRFEIQVVDESPDELGFLSRNFNQMMERTKQLVIQIEKEEQEKRELQISMLQAQINPHFLFNTLNTLRWISVMSGAKQVGDGVLALSDLLRNTIIHKGEYIPIQEEIQNIHNYIYIQKLRYGDCFEVKYQLPQASMQYQTLKFILQPIVENAIIHGGGAEDQPLHITIMMTDEGDYFCISIVDDGKGFEADTLSAERRVDKLSGIGIANVHDRLKLHFGDPYGVMIKSELGRGTNVQLYIPKIGRGDHV